MKTVCSSLIALSTLVSFNVNAQSKLCGLKGDVSSRIKDCAETNGHFSLVSRYAKGKELYLDQKTKLVWSETLKDDYSYHYDNVSTICKKTTPEFADLNLNWKLPTIYHFFDLIKNDSQKYLPNTKGETLWSSTSDKFYVNSRYIFDSGAKYKIERDGGVVFKHLEVEWTAKVKCIAEIK
jgi:hypothetical protein